MLPEHEGKYKIVLPSGSTKKSKEILAKHSALQSDKMEKKSIFDRLTSKDVEMADSTSNEPSKSSRTSSSIFNRLGNYKELEKKIEKNSIAFSGILKNSPTHMVRNCLLSILFSNTLFCSPQKELLSTAFKFECPLKSLCLASWSKTPPANRTLMTTWMQLSQKYNFHLRLKFWSISRVQAAPTQRKPTK